MQKLEEKKYKKSEANTKLKFSNSEVKEPQQIYFINSLSKDEKLQRT